MRQTPRIPLLQYWSFNHYEVTWSVNEATKISTLAFYKDGSLCTTVCVLMYFNLHFSAAWLRSLRHIRHLKHQYDKKLSSQHPGHRHLVQCDHHPADDVQHLRVPGGPGVAAAGALQSSADVLGSLPDAQHLLPLLGFGTLSHTHTCMSALHFNMNLYKVLRKSELV